MTTRANVSPPHRDDAISVPLPIGGPKLRDKFSKGSQLNRSQ